MSTVMINLETDTVVLPDPIIPATASLQQALRLRHSGRTFLPDALELGTLSALLWAAFGVNRRGSGDRTAPSAHNWQEITVFAVLPEGAYRYDATGHKLLLVRAEDLRSATGTQDFVATAPLNLVYVADFSRMQEVTAQEQAFLAGADAGCIAQNVYLACAALGLGTVVRGLIDRRHLAATLGLTPTERVVLAQSVGMARV